MKIRKNIFPNFETEESIIYLNKKIESDEKENLKPNENNSLDVEEKKKNSSIKINDLSNELSQYSRVITNRM
jgi:hypothetical protein